MAFMPEDVWEVNPKIVYIVRNPKDAAISYYHHLKNVRGFKGTLEDFLGLYLSGQSTPINIGFCYYTTKINKNLYYFSADGTLLLSPLGFLEVETFIEHSHYHL